MDASANERAPGGETFPPPQVEAEIRLNLDEKALLSELLEAERAKLLVEIRHTDHRAYRQELRRRLDTVERLLARCCAA